MTQTLKGKVALVTGASSGLGRRFALVLAEAGAKVGLAARNVGKLEKLAAEIESSGGKAFAVAMDVHDVSAIRAGVGALEAALGPLDILVNNSGVSTPQKAVDVEEADYDFILDTNTKGAFFVAQAAGRSMIKRGQGGRIINIASTAAVRTLSQLSVYCMSKAAVAHMTRSLALEWARYNVNVNAICPGYIATGMNADYLNSEASAKLKAMTAKRRWGKEEDLDGLLLLLAGGSDFINGAIITADDGMSVI